MTKLKLLKIFISVQIVPLVYGMIKVVAQRLSINLGESGLENTLGLVVFIEFISLVPLAGYVVLVEAGWIKKTDATLYKYILTSIALTIFSTILLRNLI